MNSGSSDIRGDSDISVLLNPKSIAIVGASEDIKKFGGRIVHYLLKHRFPGEVYLINPKSSEIFGRKTYPSLDAVSGSPEVVLIAASKPHVLAAVESAGKLGAKVLVIVSNGYADAGDREAEETLVTVAHSYGMRIVGPNVMGYSSPANGLAMMASHVMNVDKLQDGNVGIISQSGGVLSALMDFFVQHGCGMSHTFPTGNQADLDFCDFANMMVDDPATQVICTYVEGIKSPERFTQVARRVQAAGKPWLMMKSGRTEAGMEAAFSHTASLASSHAAFANICRDNGIVLLEDFEALVTATLLMSRHPKAKVDKLAVLSPSGGSCVMTADLFSDYDLPLVEFSASTHEKLAGYFPAGVVNPIDTGIAIKDPIVGSCGPSAEVVSKDPNVDLLLGVISTCPDVRLVTQLIADGAGNKPCLLVIQPAAMADSARAYLRDNAIPYTDSLHTAIRVIKALRDANLATGRDEAVRPEGCSLPSSLPQGVMDEQTTKALLKAYGIRTNAGLLSTNADEAQKSAANLICPLVLKVASPDIVHKADVGGVMLNISSPEAMGEAVRKMQATLARTAPNARIEGFLVQEQVSGLAEVMIGVQQDALFGPMVMVGAGGSLVELLADVATATAPISLADAERMLNTLKISTILHGTRGQPPLDIGTVADVICRVSWLAHDLSGQLLELDINPLFVAEDGKGAVAVDARALMVSD